MTPYITISLEDGEPIVVVDDLDDRSETPIGIEWPATRRGFVMAGRHVWLAFDTTGYTHSSTLDFPGECGVGLTADEVHGLIHQGIEEASGNG
jgi:hypothetical protein